GNRHSRAEGMARSAPLRFYEMRFALERERQNLERVQSRFHSPRMRRQSPPPPSQHHRSLPNALASGGQQTRNRRSLANSRHAEGRRQSALYWRVQLQRRPNHARRENCSRHFFAAALLHRSPEN